MLEVRYVAGKVILNFVCAIVGGAIAVAVIASLWQGAATIGGITGMVVVLVMLLPGVIKRAARLEPILVMDGRGVAVQLLNIGTIAWNQIKFTRISGVPWVTGQRLMIEYSGPAPKVGFWAKLNWGIQSKQRGDAVRLSIGFVDLTNQSKHAIEAALSRVPAHA
jgi:hypothetical protein